MNYESTRILLESAYESFHHPRFIHPDPLEMVLRAQDEDREFCALLAAAYSFGRVDLILAVLEKIFRRLDVAGGGVVRRLCQTDDSGIYRLAEGISYRFFKPADLFRLLTALRDLYFTHGSAQIFFSGLGRIREIPEPDDLLSWYRASPVMTGLANLHAAIYGNAPDLNPMYFPDPAGNGACKRFHLFLRWMTRKDAIDPGVWTNLGPQDLWIPLDTHLLRHGAKLGFTKRKQADARAVTEVSLAFRKLNPLDPCRYDFCLSRMGINPLAKGMEEKFYGAADGK